MADRIREKIGEHDNKDAEESGRPVQLDPEQDDEVGRQESEQPAGTPGATPEKPDR